MSLLVTGSIGIDTVRTQLGVSKDCLGGSAIYFSLAASFFAPVRLVGVIGNDCPFDLEQVFAGKDVDLAGLERRAASKTFRWAGTYHGAMNERTTDSIELNVLAEAPPKVPDVYRDSKFVFLANTAPALQIELVEQVDDPAFVAADTMNCWITDHAEDLKKLLGKIDCLIINDEEARLLSGKSNLISAADAVIAMGPKVVIVKKGESGSLMSSAEGDRFILPAYPAEVVKDPTGAGDSFAGGFMGYLSQVGKVDAAAFRKAIAYGTVVASFTISDFSLAGLEAVGNNDIAQRLEKLKEVTSF